MILPVSLSVRLSLLLPIAMWVAIRADAAARADVQSEDPSDYVQVHGGKLTLAGKPFVIRGTNYFGSWRSQHTIDAGNGIEQSTVWAFYHDWDDKKLEEDLQFVRSQLNATAVRIGTPAESDFSQLVQYHGYQPWYDRDGKITEQYKAELLNLADIAYKKGIRIQFCLLWNVGNEIAKDPNAFNPDGQMDRLYSNQVYSIVRALRNHPGVLGYSIGNEVLVNWPINGTHTSSYERQAAGFVVRRLQQVREVAPHQLITTDEVAHAQANEWYAPGPEFAVIGQVDAGTGPRTIRLADIVDYIGAHFYPETLGPQDLTRGFSLKIADARQQMMIYLKAANEVGKPVSLNEFGLKVLPETLLPDQYSTLRDQFFHELIDEGQNGGLQGLLAWGALPEIVLITGQYIIRGSTLNAYSPIEVDIDEPNHPQRRVLFYKPQWSLFQFRSGRAIPDATPAARAIASAWGNVSTPIPPSLQAPSSRP